MNLCRNLSAALMFALIFAFAACVDISNRKAPETPPETESADGEVYRSYNFTEDDERFLAGAVFVGDSLAADLSELGLAGTVMGDNGLSPSAMDGFKSPDGLDIITALINSDAGAVAMMFKAGDEGDIAAYTGYIKKIRAWIPNAAVYVLSAPPVAAPPARNAAIDGYNAALEQSVAGLGDGGVRYVDIGGELKNGSGALKSLYSAGGGSDKLTEKAYYAVLWQLCRNV
ncbi:MAG: hypothetical protein LBI38_04190 [Oscillospiraceae bacterium]|jgi:hypothetical protein|nr:hypothetical protein [Oscillospiraceae bacterium]